jgi:predicted DCC family thiol-disulfide oxidoreductase YuxK
MGARVLVFFDSQCAICQAGVSWLRWLDRKGRTQCLPLDPVALEQAGFDPGACARQIHVLTPQRRVLAGWNAVAYLARLFPATWLAGALGAAPPFRRLGKLLYGWVADKRYALGKRRGGGRRST